MPDSKVLKHHYPWQESHWSDLIKRLNSGRLPHALLLSSPSGCGKRDFSLAFAAKLLCLEAGSQPCGHCKSCLLNREESHPDLVVIEPEQTGKTIKVDQIRALNGFIGSTAQQGGYRVVIINPAEQMNANAANALLKALEEPGKQTLFMLVTHAYGQLVPTIRSRCQQLNLGIPDAGLAHSWLQQEGHIEAERAELLLSITGGAPLQALNMSLDGSLEQRLQVIKGLERVLQGQSAPVEVAAEWKNVELNLFLDWFGSWIGDISRYALTGQNNRVLNRDAESLIENAVNRAQTRNLFDLADKIRDYRILLAARTNPNKQLLLEDLLIQWSQLAR